jgi:hypothetical protein
MFLWKESLNSDGQQFHQYHQKEQHPLALTLWTQKSTTTYDVRNPGPVLEQVHKYGGVKPVSGS